MSGVRVGYPSVLVLVRSPLGLRVSSRTGSSQQSPAPWLLLTPSATPWHFPMSDARRVYFVDSFIARGSQLHAHTKSPVSHLSRSHLHWLANCSYPNGGKPSPSLHLALFVHKFNWLTSCYHGASTGSDSGEFSYVSGQSLDLLVITQKHNSTKSIMAMTLTKSLMTPFLYLYWYIYSSYVCRLLVTMDSGCSKTSSNGLLRSNGT